MSIASIDDLTTVLRESQRLGFLGDRSIPEVIAHARGFVAILADLEPLTPSARARVVDLGAGGGVPGLVIAYDRPDLDVTLLDRRAKRTDFLERMVRRLGWTDRVSVASADAQAFAAANEGVFDAVVARGFGAPSFTVTVAGQLARPGGCIVVSEPPSGHVWDPAILSSAGVESERSALGMAVLRRRQ
jgi:16S rRNA (guanine527-N7)-methyltransferase